MNTALADAFADLDMMSTMAKAPKKSKPGRQSRDVPEAVRPDANASDNEAQRAVSQYQAYRDWVYASIRPIATRIAGQEIKVGTKSVSLGAPIGEKTGIRGGWAKSSRANMYGLRTKAAIAEGITPLDHHPVLDVFENPNELMVQWMLMYLTVASLQITGRAYWLLVDGGANDLQIWPVPVSWVTPVHKPTPFAQYKIRNPTASKSFDIPGEDIVNFYYPDPLDPTKALGPLQAIAKAVSTDDKLQQAQLAQYQRGFKPGVIIKAAEMQLPSGQKGPRPVLTPEQRSQLITMIKQAYAGVERFEEPAIIDGLIEDIYPFTSAVKEMDYVGSSELTKGRVMMGFGVNGISIGQVESANRASSYTADYNLCANVLHPLCKMMSQVMTKRMAWRFGGGQQNGGTKAPAAPKPAAQPAPKPGEKPSNVPAPAGADQSIAGASSGRLYIWIDPPQPYDADLELQRLSLLQGAGAINKNEMREAFDLAPMPDGDKYPDEIAAEQMSQQQAREDQIRGEEMARADAQAQQQGAQAGGPPGAGGAPPKQGGKPKPGDKKKKPPPGNGGAPFRAAA